MSIPRAHPPGALTAGYNAQAGRLYRFFCRLGSMAEGSRAILLMRTSSMKPGKPSDAPPVSCASLPGAKSLTFLLALFVAAFLAGAFVSHPVKPRAAVRIIVCEITSVDVNEDIPGGVGDGGSDGCLKENAFRRDGDRLALRIGQRCG
jgi:hypothetical protein